MHLSLFHGDEAEGPRVFALPPGADYAAGFAAGLATRLAGAPPEAMLAVQVLVNTRRAARSLEEALADRGGISFLPRLALLETAADQLAPALLAESQPPPVDPLLRYLSLLRLVAAWQGRAGGVFPEAAAPELAESLADLIDELDEAGLDGAALSAALPEGTAPELASHWARALEFLEIVRRHWPALREERMPGALDPAARLRASADRLIAAWAAAPPKTPLIVAGSTGSRPITAALMAAIARLDQGAVVLPGFDTTIEPASWENAGPDHPMAPFRGFLERLALRPADIRPWLPDSTPHGPRHRLLAEALRPAPVTDAWAARRPELAALAEDATAGITLVKAAHPRAEAAALALAIRRALETPGQTIAVVTRDARLARRLTAELERFGVLPDDSLGRPLALAPAGIFAGLVLDAAMTPGDPVALAALLGHPFCRAGQERARHRRLARSYERQVLRERGLIGGPGAPLLPPWPEREADPETAMRESWRAGIAQALAPLAEALAAATPLATTIAHHRAAIDALAATPDEDAAHPFDDGADGRALDRLSATLSTAAAADGGAEAGTKLGGPAYAALLGRLMRAETLRPEGALPHPRVAIWGTMEARTAAADLTIIAGLNEGVWPPVPDTGPWLSRPMRAALGLPAPERAVGLSAHDFLQAASRPQVILSRSLSDEGAPTVASRWLLRIETLLAGTAPEALTAMGKRGEELLDLLPALDLPGTPDDPALRTPDDPALRPAERPCPRPPQSARPRTLSATDLETLIRDPYAVYA
ncbi:MAG: double-strand break repair protein AddB, partial [Pseudomonadota bacterium]